MSKNSNRFSIDGQGDNELDRLRRVIRTILVNDKIRFPDFQVVTGITREYLSKINVEEKATKYDPIMIVDFFNKKTYESVYKEQCYAHHPRMRYAYAHMKTLPLVDLDIFSEFDSAMDNKGDPGISEVVPLIGYFGKFAISKFQQAKYDLTALEIIVISQILSANKDVLVKMQLYEEEINMIKDNFVLYIPPLFVRHCPLTLPVIVLPELLEKIKKVHEEEEKQMRNLMKIKQMEEERIIFERQREEREKEEMIICDASMDDFVMQGVHYEESKDNIILIREEKITYYSKESIFNYDFEGEDTGITSDVFDVTFNKMPMISKIVLSRVCRMWYRFARRMRKESFLKKTLLPKSMDRPWITTLRSMLYHNDFKLYMSGFTCFVLGYVEDHVRDLSDFLDFLLTYSVKSITPGSVLLLSIFYVHTRAPNINSEDRCELIDIYNRISEGAKRHCRERIRYGKVKCTGYSFRQRRCAYAFDGIRYCPILEGDTFVWNGWESVGINMFKFDRDRFHLDMGRMFKIK